MFTVCRLPRGFKIPWMQGPPHPLRQPMPIMQKSFFYRESTTLFFVTQELKEPPCTWLHGDIVFDQSADYARSTKAEVSLPTHYLPKLQGSHSKDDKLCILCSHHGVRVCVRAIPSQPPRAIPSHPPGIAKEGVDLLEVDHTLLLALFAMGGTAAWHTELHPLSL